MIQGELQWQVMAALWRLGGGTVEQADESYGFDIKQMREGGLVDAFLPGEVRQYRALGAGQAQFRGTGVLLKAPPDQAGGLMNDETDHTVGVARHQNGPGEKLAM